MQGRVELTVSLEELNLILVSLGQMPYAQVHELIARLQTEVGPQLVSASPQGDANTEASAGTQ